MSMTSGTTRPGPDSWAAGGMPAPRPPIRGPLRRLLVWIVPANMGIFLLWGAIPNVLLPLQVAGIDPEHKIANLAVITTIGAFSAMVAQPIAGAISDRTRTRFGRRAPWLVLGALVGGISLIGMSIANTVATIALTWTAVQIAFNFVQGPLSAVLPDRVPASLRGIFAATAGFAAMAAAIGGAVLGALFADAVPMGYLTLAGAAIVLIALFVVFAKDAPSAELARERFSAVDFLRTFWVNPVRHPDFFWAFTGRLLLYTGYFSVTGYLLYLLSDYIGLGGEAAASVPLVSLASLVGMLPAILLGGWLSDRLGRRKIFVFLSSVIVGLGFLMPFFSPTLPAMFVMSIVSGFGFGAFQAVDQALITLVLPDAKSHAKDLGIVNIAATLPQTLAPAVGGGIVLAFGFAGLFPVAIALSVLGAFAVLFIRSVR